MPSLSFLIKKFILYLIYPTTFVFILLFIISIYVILGKRKVRRRFLLFVVIIVYYFSSTPFLPYLLLKPLEADLKRPPLSVIKNTKAFILLTGGAYENPSLFPEEKLNRDALLRLISAIELKRLFPQKELVIIGGNFKAQNYTEASVYKKVAEHLGVTQNITVIENVFDTKGSVIALKKVFKPEDPLLVITSAYHLKRSIFLFHKYGFKNVVPYPSNYDYKLCKPWNKVWYLFPKPLYLELTTKAIHEYLGLIYYHLFN